MHLFFQVIANRLRPRRPFTSQETEMEERFHAAFQSLLNFLNRGSDDKVIIDVCNKVIFDKKYPVLESYQNNAISYYEAQSETFDFVTQGAKLTKEINNWVSFKTMVIPIFLN